MARMRGFSLVELLVVVAIIIVLVSMLLPSYSILDMFIRNRGCEGRLKDIHSVFMAYANLNNGWYPYDLDGYYGQSFRAPAATKDPWTTLTNVKELLHCGGKAEIFYCTFDPCSDALKDSWPSSTWWTPILQKSSYIGDKYYVYVGYTMLIYRGWMYPAPHPTSSMLGDPRSATGDVRYTIGNVNGDGDIPIVADRLHFRNMDYCFGWYHGGGVSSGQGKYDGLFNSSCNTLFNGGFVVHKEPKELDPNKPAFRYGNSDDRWWFALSPR